MNFELTTEQQMLQDSVRRFVSKECKFEIQRRQNGPEYAARNWQALADNGWLSAAIPEQYGGLGGSIVDSVLIGMELGGRGLVADPFASMGVLGAQVILHAGTAAQKERLLPLVAAGSLRIALAHREHDTPQAALATKTRALKRDGSYVLNGSKNMVLGAPAASAFIVVASLNANDEQGAERGLFLVPADTAGVRVVNDMRLHDGSWASDLEFTNVQVPASARLGTRYETGLAMNVAIAHAIAVQCAELVGAMDASIEATAEYLKIRKQFGTPLSAFQALQHRLADLAAHTELARSMLFALLEALEHPEEDRERDQQTISAAKTFIARAAKHVTGQAIQLHGGIGMTEECLIGNYFKRAVVADLVFGTSAEHEAAYAWAIPHRSN